MNVAVRPAHIEVKNALLFISKVCVLALQLEVILDDELVEIKDTVFTINKHYLTHLMSAIKTLGPFKSCKLPSYGNMN
ncbi:unnamed protein product [Cunninghamella echinulata]